VNVSEEERIHVAGALDFEAKSERIYSIAKHVT
jgi:hypothetical protein